VLLSNICVVGLCCDKICVGVCVGTAVCGEDHTKASARATFREDSNCFMFSNKKLSNTVEVFQQVVRMIIVFEVAIGVFVGGEEATTFRSMSMSGSSKPRWSKLKLVSAST